MIRAIIFAAALMTGVIPAIAKDNNPFSGATSISVEMTREGISPKVNNRSHKSHVLPAESITHPDTMLISSTANEGTKINMGRPFRLRCTLDGRPINWKERARHYRLRLAGESIDVPPDAAGPMMVLLWAGGVRCR